MYLVVINITSCKDSKSIFKHSKPIFKHFNKFENAVAYCRSKVECSFNRRVSDNHWEIRDPTFDGEINIIEVDDPKD